jgi:hypothetical protein
MAAHPQRDVHDEQSAGAGKDEEVGPRQRQQRVEWRMWGLRPVLEVGSLRRAGAVK